MNFFLIPSLLAAFGSVLSLAINKFYDRMKTVNMELPKVEAGLIFT